jgi:dienelactone hydrolase
MAEALTRNDTRRRRTRFVLFFAALVGIFLARPVAHHARATSLLVAFSDPKAKPAVTEELITIDVPASPAGPARTVKARIFSPPGSTPGDRPAVVLVHGVQYLGIEEPRLQRFAKSIVSAGIVVLTPQVDELADYAVSPRSIETVGAAIRALRTRSGGRSQIGLMGTSFGGGVALLTAADQRFADDVAFVVAIGAHDDLARVSRFFATDEIPEVSGTTKQLHAHGYGSTVLVYTHADEFFPAEDVPAARDALRLFLREKRDAAREAAKALSPASKAKMDVIFGPDISALRPELLAMVDRRNADMNAVSPHDRLAGLRAHVYLLHGAGDTVIPATETLWLAHDVPPAALRMVLVSPAIEHVELKEPSIGDQWSLIHFMGDVIGEAEAARD